MADLVFCKGCRHIFVPAGCGFRGAQCLRVTLTKRDFFEEWQTHPLCSEANKRNDCRFRVEPLKEAILD